jgi:hypothetical protein
MTKCITFVVTTFELLSMEKTIIGFKMLVVSRLRNISLSVHASGCLFPPHTRYRQRHHPTSLHKISVFHRSLFQRHLVPLFIITGHGVRGFTRRKSQIHEHLLRKEVWKRKRGRRINKETANWRGYAVVCKVHILSVWTLFFCNFLFHHCAKYVKYYHNSVWHTA